MQKQAIEAVSALAEKVYAPVFLTKLASAGIVPENDEQVNNLYQLAYQLKVAALQQLGLDTTVDTDPEMNRYARQILKEDRSVKQAAATIVQNLDELSESEE